MNEELITLSNLNLARQYIKDYGVNGEKQTWGRGSIRLFCYDCTEFNGKRCGKWNRGCDYQQEFKRIVGIGLNTPLPKGGLKDLLDGMIKIFNK